MANGDSSSDCLLSTLIDANDTDDELENGRVGSRKSTDGPQWISHESSSTNITADNLSAQVRPKRKSVLLSSQPGKNDGHPMELDNGSPIEPSNDAAESQKKRRRITSSNDRPRSAKESETIRAGSAVSGDEVQPIVSNGNGPQDIMEDGARPDSRQSRFNTRKSTAPRTDSETSKLLVQLQEYALHTCMLLSQQDQEINRLNRALAEATMNQDKFNNFMKETGQALRTLQKQQADISQHNNSRGPPQPVTNNVVLHAGEIDSLSSSVAEMYYRIANVESLKLNVDLLNRRVERLEPIALQHAYGGSIQTKPARSRLAQTNINASVSGGTRPRYKQNQPQGRSLAPQDRSGSGQQTRGGQETGDEGDISEDTVSLLDDLRGKNNGDANDWTYKSPYQYAPVVQVNTNTMLPISSKPREDGGQADPGTNDNQQEQSQLSASKIVDRGPAQKEYVNLGCQGSGGLSKDRQEGQVEMSSLEGVECRDVAGDHFPGSDRMFLTPKGQKQVLPQTFSVNENSPITPYPGARSFKYPTQRSQTHPPKSMLGADMERPGHSVSSQMSDPSTASACGAQQVDSTVPTHDARNAGALIASRTQTNTQGNTHARRQNNPLTIRSVDSNKTQGSHPHHQKDFVSDSNESHGESVTDVLGASISTESSIGRRLPQQQDGANFASSLSDQSAQQVMSTPNSATLTMSSAEQDDDTSNTSVGAKDQLDQSLPKDVNEMKASLLKASSPPVYVSPYSPVEPQAQLVIPQNEPSAEIAMPQGESASAQEPAGSHSSFAAVPQKNHGGTSQGKLPKVTENLRMATHKRRAQNSSNTLNSSADEAPERPIPSIPGGAAPMRRERRKTLNQNPNYVDNTVARQSRESDNSVSEPPQQMPPRITKPRSRKSQVQSQPGHSSTDTQPVPPVSYDVSSLFTRSAALYDGPALTSPPALTQAPQKLTTPYAPVTAKTSDRDANLLPAPVTETPEDQPCMSSRLSSLLRTMPSSTLGPQSSSSVQGLNMKPTSLLSSATHVAPALSSLTPNQMHAELQARARQAFLQDQQMRAKLGLEPGSGSSNELFYKEMFWRRKVRTVEKRERQARVKRACLEMSKRDGKAEDGGEADEGTEDGVDI